MNRIKSVFGMIVVAVAFLAVNGNSIASSFPFREVELGDVVPDATVTDYKGKATVSFSDMKGKPYAVLFWGADIEAKKRRAIEALSAFQKMQPFLKERNITMLTIDAQGDSSTIIDEVVAKVDGAFPVYVDSEQVLYGKLGIYVMPAFLLVSADGKVAAGMGYSRDLADQFRGEVQILLGEKTREQVELELHPVVVEKSEEEKNANRHRNMGFVMARRGMPEAAIPEFEAVIKLLPDDAASLVELGCLYCDLGKMEMAAKYLDMGLTLEPDSIRGQICDAKLMDSQGETKAAIDDLRSLMLRNSRNSQLHYVLGTLLEKSGQIDQAAIEYRKAYELLEKSDMLHGKE